jgi:precorrin-2 dehydrogenase/sirohydrochlorin ferrochelatase
MYYPVMINVKDKEITVIGGGKVAYRKVKSFISFGCTVRVISPYIIDELENIEDKVILIRDFYKEDYIKNSFIVVASTDNKDLNEQIGLYCKENNKLCNVVDNPNLSSYIVPSIIKRGDLVISISTSGKSPSLASKIKKDIEKQYSDDYEEYVELLGNIRNEVLKKYEDKVEKKKLLNNLINMTIEELKSLDI